MMAQGRSGEEMSVKAIDVVGDARYWCGNAPDRKLLQGIVIVRADRRAVQLQAPRQAPTTTRSTRSPPQSKLVGGVAFGLAAIMQR